MPRELYYSRRALVDLDSITRWLTQPGAGNPAFRRLDAIWSAIARLREYPCHHVLGRRRGTRELSCAGGYLVLYRVTPDTGHNETAGDVLILRIFGPGQSRNPL